MPVFLRWLLNLGPTNPIAVRLVQNASRRTKHLYVRSAYLAVLIVVLLWLLVVQGATGGTPDYTELAKIGAQAFVTIAYLQIALITILAPVFMAGAIAQESDPRTWDILLTTPLGKLQIVLGNLLGRLFLVLALLVCSLPLFALTQFFGGVEGRAIFASYAISASAATLVGAIAIALSVSRLAGRRAVFTFYIAVVSYVGITAAADAVLRQYGAGQGPGGQGVTWVTAINPFLSLHSLLNPATYPRAVAGVLPGLEGFMKASPVTAWCTLSLGLALVLTLASTLTVQSGGIVAAAKGGSREPWYRKLLNLSGPNSEFRAPRTVGSNPIAWREASARNATLGRIIARWTFVGVGLVTALVLALLYHVGTIADPRTFRLIVAVLTATETAVIALIAVNMAATAVSREREDGTLDLLLTTPITPSMYLWGKLRGLVAYLLPLIAVPVFTLLIAGLYPLTLGLLREPEGSGVLVTERLGRGGTLEVPLILPEAGVVAAFGFVPFIAFCVMVGLQWSLKSKGTIGSVIATVGVVAIAAGTIGLCGWNAGREFAVVGPALAGLNPAPIIRAVTDPKGAFDEGIEEAADASEGLTASRIAMLIGAIIGALINFGVVYGIHAAMVKNFDATVRKLAGTK